jgi:predicted secreted protein
MDGKRQRRYRILAALAAGLLAAGCLGDDYRDVELALSDWDHGWLAVVEPGEAFTVGLPEHAQYPGAAWTIVADGSPTLEVVGSTVEQPPPEEQAPAIWIFNVVARDLGEAPLAFQLDVDGSTVDRVDLTVTVVDDACASDEGIAAPRCGGQQQITAPQGISELEHGSTVVLAEGEDAAVVLTGNATRPEAVWRLSASGPLVVSVSAPREVGSRTPGNWDTDDATEPGTFLPRSEFLVTGEVAGSVVLRFELLDGEVVVESATFIFDVGGSA